jgi:hypothetical protein
MQFRFVGCIRKEKSLPANKLKGEKEYGQDYFIRTLDFNSIYILGDKQNMLVTIGPEHVKNGHYYLQKNQDQFCCSCPLFLSVG